MKIPSSGPWFAPGANTMGPKNPVQKPIAPSIIAKDKMLEINPSGVEPVRCHV